MGIRVREAQPKDARALAKLVMLSDGGPKVRTDVGQIEICLARSATERILVAEESRVIAFAALQITASFQYERSTAELTELFVLDRYRRQGVASSLLRAARGICEAENCLEMFLRVNRNNRPAIELYKSCGLVDSGHLEFRLKYY